MTNNEKHSCPCCGNLTQLEPHSFEICDVCWWQDDGQDDVDAHIEYGGPNKTTLWEARRNVLRFGASEMRYANGPLMKFPMPAEHQQLRQWYLLDDVAVEYLPMSAGVPWASLHDAQILSIKWVGSRLSIRVHMPWLMSQFLKDKYKGSGSGFLIDLIDCQEAYLLNLDKERVDDVDDIVASKLEILSGNLQNNCVRLWCVYGELVLKYRYCALRFENGDSLAFAALDACSESYWDSFHASKSFEESN